MSDPPKNRIMDRAESFQRHYFPEIFTDSESLREEERTLLRGFQRTNLAPGDGGRSQAGGPSPPAARPEGGNPRQAEATNQDRLYTQGYENGERAGITAERGRLESIVKMLHLALEEVENFKADLIRATERQTLGLALAIARKILQTEVQTNPEAVARVVRGALEHAREAEQLTVKVNPGDLQILDSMEFRSPELSGVLEKCNFEGDDQVTPGGCLIQSELGEIDARITTQLQFIENRFKDLFKEAES